MLEMKESRLSIFRALNPYHFQIQGLRTPSKDFLQHIPNLLADWADWLNYIVVYVFGILLVAFSKQILSLYLPVLDFLSISHFLFIQRFSDILKDYLWDHSNIT